MWSNLVSRSHSVLRWKGALGRWRSGYEIRYDNKNDHDDDDNDYDDDDDDDDYDDANDDNDHVEKEEKTTEQSKNKWFCCHL